MLESTRLRYIVKPARVIENKPISGSMHILRIELIRHSVEVEPFNFFNIWVPRVDEIPLSIAYADSKSLFFIYRIRGVGTKTLSQLKPGEFIGVKGPLGKGFKPLNNRRWLIVAGGVGIAPVPFLLSFAIKTNTKIDVIWGVKKSDEFFDLSNVFGLKQRGWRLIKVSEDCQDGLCGTALSVLNSVSINDYDVVLAIGPQQMLLSFCRMLKDRENVYVSLENMVKCGIGVCGSCYLKGSHKLLCIDGPVFKCSEVVDHLESSIS
ncbi:MAG: dihydroorotate dehydrogenase [Ignisphaera sp.]